MTTPANRQATIYLISGPNPDHRYVGCTTQSINERFIKHKSRAKKDDFRHSKLCLAMREHGAEAFTIEALKTVPFALRAQEEAIAIATRGLIGPNGLNLRLPKFRHLVPPYPCLFSSKPFSLRLSSVVLPIGFEHLRFVIEAPLFVVCF